MSHGAPAPHRLQGPCRRRRCSRAQPSFAGGTDGPGRRTTGGANARRGQGEMQSAWGATGFTSGPKQPGASLKQALPIKRPESCLNRTPHPRKNWDPASGRSRGQKGEDKGVGHRASCWRRAPRADVRPEGSPAGRTGAEPGDSGPRQDTSPSTPAVGDRCWGLHRAPKAGTATYPGVQGWETSRSRCTLSIVGGCTGSQKTRSLS